MRVDVGEVSRLQLDISVLRLGLAALRAHALPRGHLLVFGFLRLEATAFSALGHECPDRDDDEDDANDGQNHFFVHHRLRRLVLEP